MKSKHILTALVVLGLSAANSFAGQAEGDLVKGSGGTVYLIKDGKRCSIPNLAVFEAKGFKEDKIITLADADLKAIPEGSVVPMPYPKAKDGDLVKAGGASVFVIKKGKRCGIPNMEVFRAKGFETSKIIMISDADIEAIPEGDAVE